MATVKAKFDGRVFVPEGPVDLPVGYELEISVGANGHESASNPVGSVVPPVEIGAEKEKTALQELAEIASRFAPSTTLPKDFAAQHDHFLCGLPKRE